MTDREKAIVMAYTGIAMFEGEKIDEFYKYLKELYGRPVYTHEIVMLDIAERAKPDFIRLCEETHDKRTETHSCDYGRKETHGDVIRRSDAISIVTKHYRAHDNDLLELIAHELERLPSAEPEPLSDAYMKAVLTWLINYQIKAAELKGRYTPYEVLSWVINDWRKEHERFDKKTGSG